MPSGHNGGCLLDLLINWVGSSNCLRVDTVAVVRKAILVALNSDSSDSRVGDRGFNVTHVDLFLLVQISIHEWQLPPDDGSRLWPPPLQSQAAGGHRCLQP